MRPNVPKVTVLMTLHNKGPYVEEAVRSVLASTLADLELLVVDDASTDGGLDVVKGITDPRIRILESALNTGRPAAANRGYDAATGEYIAVLDADDRIHPERLARQASYLDGHPEVGACGSWLQFFGGRDLVHRLPAEDEEARALSVFGVPVSYGACMFRRSVLEEHGLRCPAAWHTPGMDYLFMLDVGRHTRYANIPEVLTDYRIGAQNMRHGRDARRDLFLVSREMFRLLGIPASEPEVWAHLHLHEPPHPPLGAAGVWRVHRWKQELVRTTTHLFPGPSFSRQLEQRWDRLFHILVKEDAGASLMHIALSGTWRSRLGYWLSVTRRRWLAGKASDEGAMR
jgi:glycosyltransferase involved in cell wall biosynthesis